MRINSTQPLHPQPTTARHFHTRSLARRRGAHTFFLRQQEVARWGGYTVNLIHYEDAASLCLAVLQGRGSPCGPYRGQAFLGCDGSPVTFEVRFMVTGWVGWGGGVLAFCKSSAPASVWKHFSLLRGQGGEFELGAL